MNPARTVLIRGLRRVGTLAAGERTTAFVAAGVTAWMGVYLARGQPPWMATALQTAAAATTLVMVFVIQHGQRRTETAMQLKLDELVRVSDGDDELAEIEHADPDEFERRRHRRAPDGLRQCDGEADHLACAVNEPVVGVEDRVHCP